jgi:hypothetical protein
MAVPDPAIDQPAVTVVEIDDAAMAGAGIGLLVRPHLASTLCRQKLTARPNDHPEMSGPNL